MKTQLLWALTLATSLALTTGCRMSTFATNTHEFSGPAHYPVAGRISSSFGPRKDPFHGRLVQHNGVDFAAPEGTPIVAYRTGRVIWCGNKGGYGRTVKISHTASEKSLYAHMQTIDVQCGQTVRAGEQIGTVGRTGRATGAHLHWEVHKDGVPIDPLKDVSVIAGAHRGESNSNGRVARIDSGSGVQPTGEGVGAQVNDAIKSMGGSFRGLARELGDGFRKANEDLRSILK